MKRVLLVLCLLLIPGIAETAQSIDEPVCFADEYGVRRHSPGSHPSYTFNMPGHKKQKCWFPATKDDKKWHPTRSASKHEDTKPVKEFKTIRTVAVKTTSLPDDLKILVTGPDNQSKPQIMDPFDERFKVAYDKEID